MRSVHLVLLLFYCLNCDILIDGANILGIFLTPFKSHIIIHEAIAQTLHEAGHNITILSSLPKINPSNDYHVIHIPMNKFDANRMIQQPQRHIYHDFKFILNHVLEQMNGSLHEKSMQQFLHTHQPGDFDLVVFGYFYNDFLFGIAEHFRCPIILSFMVQSTFTLDHIMGQPCEMSYVPTIYSGLKQPLGFIDRLKNFYNYFMEEFILLPWIQKRMDYYYNENFPLTYYAPLHDVYKNISIIFLNHHFSQGPIRPNQPGFIEIGGIQIPEQSQPWPKDLENDLELSRNRSRNNNFKGIIYFSLGSMIDNENLDVKIAETIIQTLSEMDDYQIIMKWNVTATPEMYDKKHIIFRSWLPQIDILADKRIKLFITHGGQGAVTEAQYFAAPMLGIPIFADQHTNMERVEKSQFGRTIDYTTLTKNSFKKAIEEVINNPIYKQNIQKFSQLYRDRPLQPRPLIKYWVEYILRYDGAKHIQSPAIHMNWWQLHSFDIFIFIITLIIFVIVMIIWMIKCIYRYFARHCNIEAIGEDVNLKKNKSRTRTRYNNQNKDKKRE